MLLLYASIYIFDEGGEILWCDHTKQIDIGAEVDVIRANEPRI
jgi:hypothetical protein